MIKKKTGYVEGDNSGDINDILYKQVVIEQIYSTHLETKGGYLYFNIVATDI